MVISGTFFRLLLLTFVLAGALVSKPKQIDEDEDGSKEGDNDSESDW